MEKYVVAVMALAGLIGVVALPVNRTWKFLIQWVWGLACLCLLNGTGEVTGLSFPVNGVTVAVTGLLGLPGIAVLALAQMIL